MTKNLLVYRVGQLGDTLVALPAMEAICKRFPSHRRVLLTDRHSEDRGYVSSWEVLEPTGWFDEVIFYEPAKKIGGSIVTAFTTAKQLRRLKPEYVFNLAPQRSRLAAVRDRLFFRQAVGVRNYYEGHAFSVPRQREKDKLPRIEPEWRRLVRIVGVNPDENSFHLAIPLKAYKEADKELVVEGFSEGTVGIAIGPGSKMPAKRWPLDRFAELGLRILRKYPDTRLFILGGKEDAPLGAELCHVWGDRGHNLAGRLSVYGSAAVLERCNLFVGNDTGAMHLAALAGTPCVALFSARDFPGKWEPYGAYNTILRHDTECAGCMLEDCTINNKQCLKLVAVDEALAAVDRIFPIEQGF